MRWTTKSTRHLAATLTEMGHSNSHSVVAKLLRFLGYSYKEPQEDGGKPAPDRDDQFCYNNKLAREFLTSGDL